MKNGKQENNAIDKNTQLFIATWNSFSRQLKYFANRLHSSDFINATKGLKEITPSKSALIGGVSKTIESKKIDEGAVFGASGYLVDKAFGGLITAKNIGGALAFLKVGAVEFTAATIYSEELYGFYEAFKNRNNPNWEPDTFLSKTAPLDLLGAWNYFIKTDKEKFRQYQKAKREQENLLRYKKAFPNQSNPLHSKGVLNGNFQRNNQNKPSFLERNGLPDMHKMYKHLYTNPHFQSNKQNKTNSNVDTYRPRFSGSVIAGRAWIAPPPMIMLDPSVMAAGNTLNANTAAINALTGNSPLASAETSITNSNQAQSSGSSSGGGGSWWMGIISGFLPSSITGQGYQSNPNSSSSIMPNLFGLGGWDCSNSGISYINYYPDMSVRYYDQDQGIWIGD